MFSTGASLVVTAVFFAIIDLKFMPIHVLFEIFGANIVINLGLLLTHRFESRFIIVECLLDITCVIGVLVVFGVIFDWYSSIPVLFLVAVAVVVYGLALITVLDKIKKDTRKINALLQKRNAKNADIAS
jgi:hypothetical protein